SGGRGLQEQVREPLLVRPGDGAQCLRQREGDEKVRHREEEGLLLVEPAGGRSVLALRAMAILTRMVAIREFPTVGTLGEMPAECLGAARCNGCHRREMAGEHT